MTKELDKAVKWEVVPWLPVETAPDGPIASEIACLKAERDAAVAKMKAISEAYVVVAETAETEDARARAAEAENTRLRALLVDAGEALRPLADAAGHHEHTHDDACVIAIPGRPGRDQPRVGQLRRARTTLVALDKAPTPKEPSDVTGDAQTQENN